MPVRAVRGGKNRTRVRIKFKAAKDTPHELDALNKTEKDYYDRLYLRLLAGEILWIGVQAFKLRMADNTYYTPDFVTLEADGSMVVHEVKGFWRDDARVKWKVAAREFFMFRFIAVQRKRGSKSKEFETEEYCDDQTSDALDS